MKILAVDNVRQRLDELENAVKAIFPDAEVKPFVDPMLAAQYGVRHNVDVIIAERTMRRMDGLEMAGVVHKFDDHIRIYLIMETNDTFDGADDSHVTGWMDRSHIEEGLRGIAKEHHRCGQEHTILSS